MKLGIIGHGEHGKDEVADRLVKFAGLRYFAGTSAYAAGRVYPWLCERYEWACVYPNAVVCWLHRREHREEWADAISEINWPDPVRLYRDCLAHQDLLTGIRWRHEYDAINAAGLVDAWIWVERPGFPLDATCELTRDDAQYRINNSGTLEQLDLLVQELARMLPHEVTT